MSKVKELEGSRMEMLERLELSNCDVISEFPLLTNLPALSEIVVSWTVINDMRNLAASTLPALRTLKLDYCTLNSFPLLNI